MRKEEKRKLVLYVNTLTPARVGLGKDYVWALDELRNLGFEPILRQADHLTSVLDIFRNLFRRPFAIVFVGIGLGFRYGSLINLIASSLWHRRVFLSWYETQWVYDRLKRELPIRARIFRALIRSKRICHMVMAERNGRFCQSLGVQASRIRVIESCVPSPDREAVDLTRCPTGDRIRVIAAATIQERKGTDIFCEAAVKVCRRLPNVDFFWYGEPLNFEPGFFDRCQAVVRSSGFENRIHFCGFSNSPSIYMALCDMFLLTSRDEPLGLAALEAMSLAKTVIAFDVGGLAELVPDCIHVIGAPDADRLASKVIELATGSREQLTREDARTRVLEDFSPRQFALRVRRAILTGDHDVGRGSTPRNHGVSH